MLKTKLFKHQQKAFDKLKSYNVGALFMDMGTGKTRTAIEFIEYRKNKISNVLWLCPVSIKLTIKKDIEKHSDLKVCLVPEENLQADIYICGLESIASSDRIYFKAIKLVDEKTFIICDESIYIKNPNSKRSYRSTNLAKNSKYKLILNGTPVSNTEADLFQQMKFLSPKILGFNSFYSFAAQHVVYSEKYPDKIEAIVGSEKIAKKIAPISYQVKKEECFDMPAKTFNSIYFDISSEAKEAYNTVKEEILEKEFEDDLDIIRLFTHLQSITCGFCSFWEKEINFDTSNKINALKSHIKSTNDKIIILSKYIKEIDQISEEIEGEKFFYYGSKKDNLEDFLKSEKGILIANHKCLSFGHNLQECSNMVFYSNTFNYAERKQAEDRIYRHGQKRKVIITTFIGENTIDEYIESNLMRKQMTLNNVESEIKKVKDKKEMLNKICKGFKVKKNG